MSHCIVCSKEYQSSSSSSISLTCSETCQLCLNYMDINSRCKLLETRWCLMCQKKFKRRITSNKLNCSPRCTISYQDTKPYQKPTRPKLTELEKLTKKNKYNLAYQKSPQGRAKRAAWLASSAGKSKMIAYTKTKKYKDKATAWRQSPIGVACIQRYDQQAANKRKLKRLNDLKLS